jgi:hypothetical protein
VCRNGKVGAGVYRSSRIRGQIWKISENEYLSGTKTNVTRTWRKKPASSSADPSAANGNSQDHGAKMSTSKTEPVCNGATFQAPTSVTYSYSGYGYGQQGTPWTASGYGTRFQAPIISAVDDSGYGQEQGTPRTASGYGTRFQAPIISAVDDSGYGQKQGTPRTASGYGTRFQAPISSTVDNSGYGQEQNILNSYLNHYNKYL